ncbi:MAG: type II secretion system F family protein [Gemmatimonadota bacterium]
MIRFRYRAAEASGRLVRGVIAASDSAEADALLLARGLAPVETEPDQPGLTSRRGPSRGELATIFRSLSTLVEAGVPLERALGATAPLARSSALRDMVEEARRHLREGKRLSAALQVADGLVPRVTLSLIEAGERGGRLDAALEQAARQLEQEAELLARVRQALAYPLILLVAGSVSVLVIVTVVLPRFARLLTEVGQVLPPATRLLLALSELLGRFGGFGLVGFLMAVGAFSAWRSTVQGRATVHRALQRLPLIGPLRHGFASARFSRALGGMLTAGVPILSALDSAHGAAADVAIGERLLRARRRIAEGEPVARSFAAEHALTDTTLQLIAVGESSGRLGDMTLRAADLAEREAESRLRGVVLLLEPALVLLFGGLVAFIAAALLQAVYSLRPIG